MSERLADTDAVELIKQSVRGALHGQTFVAGHTIDEITDLAVDAVLAHRESVLRALGGEFMQHDEWDSGEQGELWLLPRTDK